MPLDTALLNIDRVPTPDELKVFSKNLQQKIKCMNLLTNLL